MVRYSDRYCTDIVTAKHLTLLEHQLWILATHSCSTLHHSLVLLQVSEIRNSFSKALLGVTMLLVDV